MIKLILILSAKKIIGCREDIYGRTNLASYTWWYTSQPAVQLLHCFMNIFKNNKDAALFERITINSLEKIQESNGNGCLYEKNGEECRITEFQTAKDMERSAAVTLVESYLLHYFGGICDYC